VIAEYSAGDLEGSLDARANRARPNGGSTSEDGGEPVDFTAAFVVDKSIELEPED